MSIKNTSFFANNRFFHIDLLRAIAILGVMLTHSLALFLGPALINSTWNYLHFVVVAFVFCSGYVTSYTYKHINNAKSLLAWYKKRFIRLYIPFAVYVIAYTLIHWTNSSSRFLFDSLTLVGGIDVGWLTLLFIQLAVLSPILIQISRNNRHLLASLTVCGLFALITTFTRIPTEYSRAVAWFPWIFIFLLGNFIAQKEQHIHIRIRYFFLTGTVSFIVWFIFAQILNLRHEPLTLTLHKYPPDLFYFLYGIGITSALLGRVKLFKNPDRNFIGVTTFMSRNSYGMFFTHLILLQVLTKLFITIHVIPLTLVSIVGTVGVLWGLNFFLSFAKRYIPAINNKR